MTLEKKIVEHLEPAILVGGEKCMWISVGDR